LDRSPTQRAIGQCPCTGDRDFIQQCRMNQLVNESGLQRLPRTHVAAGEDHIERSLEPDEPRQSLRATCAGNETDLNLGQSEYGFRRVSRHTVGTRQRGLEATAEARPVYRGHDGRAQLLEPFEQCVPVSTHRFCLRRGLDLEEFLDVRTGHPYVGLPAADDRGANLLVALETLEHGGELLADGARERVDRRAGHVERDDRDAVPDVRREGCGHEQAITGAPRPSQTPSRRRHIRS
jgi:hypothetical protein